MPHPPRRAHGQQDKVHATMTRSRMTSRRHRPGFALLEVLISIGIFAFAMSAIAGLFVAAIYMQQQTNHQLMAGIVGQNASASLKARPFVEADALAINAGAIDTDKYVYAVELNAFPATPPTVPTVNSTNMVTLWDEEDRSFPSKTIATTTPLENKKYAWIPLVRDNDIAAASTDWSTYVFIIEVRGKTIPSVTELAVTLPAASPNVFDLGGVTTTSLEKGDFVLDNVGGIYQVNSVVGDLVYVNRSIQSDPDVGDPTSIFYVDARIPDPDNPTTAWVDGDRRSPTLKIIEVANAVQP